MNKLLCLIIFFAWPAYGQVVQTARYETPFFQESDPQYFVVPWQRNGALIYRRLETESSDLLQLIKVNTELEEEWAKSIDVSKQLSLVFSKGYDDMAYFLFKPRKFYGDFQLFAISHDSSASVVYTIKNIIPFSPTMFEIGKKNLLIAGYYNYRPVVILFSMDTGQSKLLPGFFNEPGELDQLILNEDESVNVIVSMRNTDRRRNLWIMNYTADGTSIKNTIINPPRDKNLIFGRMMKTAGDSVIMAGVYGKNVEYSRGVFVASINPTGEYTIRYYNFGDLKNFFKYMRVARQNRIEDRIERKKVKGKKLRFNYRIVVHEFIPYHDHFLMLGEAFYPIYKSTGYSGSRAVPFYNYRYNTPGSWQQSDYVFDGYRYTHAVTIGIAKDGKLLWDNSFEIKNVKSYTLDQYVHLIHGNNLNLLYSFDNKLYFKSIQGLEVVENKTEDLMKGLYENDQVKKNSTQNHHLDYWYDDYLLSYGVQELQNRSTPNVALNRKVFFVNKITFKDNP